MYPSAVEELPLLRAKGNQVAEATGPSVGPGSYNLDKTAVVNASCAPFNSTGKRRPLLSTDPALPGPGAYDVPLGFPDSTGGIGSQPFVSESSRFPSRKRDDVPGPGSYDLHNFGGTKKNPRSHKFSAPTGRAHDFGVDGTLGPGAYEPNYAAINRRHPRIANFGKYSSRDLPRQQVGPGPGSYDVLQAPRSATVTKPSSMFITKSKRSVYGDSGLSSTPGPGTYEVGTYPQRGVMMPYEQFSAFGSSSNRFASDKDENLPGPGSYTADFAPRRFHLQSGSGSAAFMATYDRFAAAPSESTPGPGVYEALLPRKREDFGEPSPFGTTVPRFLPVHLRNPPTEPVDFDGLSGGRALSRRLRRPFIPGKIYPSSAPPPLGDRSYDIKYDWPKPTPVTESTFGASTRQPLNTVSAVPGPGTYYGLDGVVPKGSRFSKSNWGRDVRFSRATPPAGRPDPGKYHHTSTFLKKSFNATIGSDTTWIE